MADNVRFGSDNGTGGLSYSGFNGFPFPFFGGTIDANHPVVVTFQGNVKVWWRVKNWNITTDLTLISTVSGPPISYPFLTGNLNPDPSNATRELELIDTTKTHNFGLTSSTGATSVFWMELPFSEAIYQSGASLIPRLVLNMSIADPTDPTVSASASFVSPGTITIAGSITNVDAGGPIAINVYAGVSDPARSSVTGSSFTLSPASYWQYAELSTGLPIYDTTTGSVLSGRSPLN